MLGKFKLVLLKESLEELFNESLEDEEIAGRASGEIRGGFSKSFLRHCRGFSKNKKSVSEKNCSGILKAILGEFTETNC